MIEIQDLSKYYGSFLAVDNIRFEVGQGEIVGFLGPNGAGKTTTMKVITCFMPPSSGNVLVDGLSVYEDSLAIRKKIGYLPESAPLYPEMGIVDYLDFVCQIREIPARERTRKIREVAEVCGLTRMIGKRIDQLSKGYKQRVGLAQALIHDPEILVLDEPTSGLDPNQIVEIRNLIKEIGQEKTVILSTHILSEVEATANRLVIINQGKIVADGTVPELKATFQQKQILHCEFANMAPDQEDQLDSLTDVDYVEAHWNPETNTMQAKLELPRNVDIREQVFDLAVANQWKLLCLYPVEVSLEEIFRQLTQEL